MKIVLDSNVLISVTNTNDSKSESCIALIEKLNSERYEIIAPVTQLWEVAAYLNHPEARKTHQMNQTASFTVKFHDVTLELFASTYSDTVTAISGADRIFVSLAKHLNVPVITNDKQILKNASLLGVRALRPEDFATNP